MRARHDFAVFWVLIAIGWVFLLIPFPESIAAAKPWLLGLVIAFFTLESPDGVGLGTAFGVGLFADAINGVLLGEQALRLVVMVYVLRRFRFRLRFFPLWQQTAAMGGVFLNDLVLSMWVRSALGNYGIPPMRFFLPALIGTLLWPVMFILLDRLRHLRRARSQP
jgi:rod shape-determining protein MreD